MYKKWILAMISVILFGFTIFSASPVGFADNDVTPLKLKATAINQKVAKVGDTMVITFEVEEDLESGIADFNEDNSIDVKHSSGKAIMTHLRYLGNNKFEFRWKLDASTLKGLWHVDSVQFSDAAGNDSYYHREDPLLAGLSYNVLDGLEDTNPPKLNNLSILTKEARPGGQVKMTFAISEASRLGPSYVNFKHDRTDSWLMGPIVYNEKTKKYEATIDLPANLKNGSWSVNYLTLADEYGNEEYYRESENSLLTGKSFIFSGGSDDSTPPVFHSLKLGATSVYGGDTFTVWVDGEDKGGISEGQISFRSSTDNGFWSPLVWDAEKRLFRADITLDVGQTSGVYFIDQVYLGDNVGNQRWVLNRAGDKFPRLTVKSVFTGVDSMSMVRGGSFDPLAGVKAYSPTEGDMARLVTVSGVVDPQTNGIYLLKYAVKGPQSGYTYKGYRWIGVNDEDNKDTSEGTLFFNTDVKVGVAQNEKLTLSQGSKVSTLKASTRLTNEGAYQLAAASNSSVSASAFSRASFERTSKLGNKISFVIDKKAPAAPFVDVVTDQAGVVKGKTEAYASVRLYINGKFLKQGKADRAGSYKLSIGKQKIGTLVKVKATDRASNAGKGRTVKVVHVPTLDVVSNKSGSVTGLTLPYATVKVYVSGKYLKQGKADGKGRYKISIKKLEVGKSVSVTSTGKDHKVSPVVKTKVVDRIAPGAPTVVKATSSSVSGKGEARATVYVFSGKLQVGKGTVARRGNFTVRIVKQEKGASLAVYLVDQAGNMGKMKIVKVY